MNKDNRRQLLLWRWPSLLTLYAQAVQGDPFCWPPASLSVCCFHCLVSAPHQGAFLPPPSSSLPKACLCQNTHCCPCLPLHQTKALQDQEWLIPTPTQEIPPCQMWHLGVRARQIFYGFEASLLYVVSYSRTTKTA